MRNKMKNRFLFILIIRLVLGCGCTLAAPAPVTKKSPPPALGTTLPPVQPLPVEVENCNKIFKTDRQKLFYLTLSSINANRFIIDEIQSKTGYTIFSVGERHFLASVITITPQASMLKITPCNNNYFFPVGIMQNMFRYIELNLNTPVEKLIVQ